MARVVSITGGKEGAGATFVSLNIAFCLSAMEHRTCLMFTDPEFSQDNFPFDIRPKGDITQLLNGEAALNDIITTYNENLDVMFAGNAFEDDTCFLPDQAKRLSDSFFHAADYDFFIIDTLAVPSKSTISFSRAAGESILVFTPDPPAITSAYSLVKAFGSNGFSGKMAAVVNQSKTAKISDMAVSKLNESIRKSYQIDITHLANIAKDTAVSRSTVSRKIFVQQSPDAAVTKELQKIANQLAEAAASAIGDAHLDTFWKAYFTLCTTGDTVPETPKEQKIDENTNQNSSSWAYASEKPIEMMEENQLFAPDTGAGEKSPGVLAQSISSLTREIHTLRTLIQRQNLSQNVSSTGVNSPLQQKVELDFDSFLSGRLK
jgi:flagellar biosynthesis protein FlhG